MAENTAISWTDHTFNPWIGCTKVSPGCANCYAATQDKLRSWTPEGWGNGKPRKRTSAANWNLPLKWDKAQERHQSFLNGTADRPRVFCASLADWLDDEVPVEWLADLLDMIRRTPNLDWLLLTKRPENFRTRMQAVLDLIPRTGINFEEAALRCRVAIMMNGWEKNLFSTWEIGIENYWIGTTVENQAMADERIPMLLQIPAKVRFLSCEPLLEKVILPIHHQSMGPSWADFHWVIVGGESGPGFRPFDPDWARSLRDQCQDSGIPFHMKQMGGLRPSTMPPISDDLMIREYPKP